MHLCLEVRQELLRHDVLANHFIGTLVQLGEGQPQLFGFLFYGLEVHGCELVFVAESDANKVVDFVDEVVYLVSVCAYR